MGLVACLVTLLRPEALFWIDGSGAVCAAQVGKPGELLSGCRDRRLAHAWAMARADSFAPAAEPAFEAIAEAAE